jgi:WD40 repeat protein
VIVSGGADATVRVWDPATGHAIGDPLSDCTSTVWGVALGRVGERDVIVSGSHDRTVRVCDAATRTVLAIQDTFDPVYAVAATANRVAAASSRAVITLDMQPESTLDDWIGRVMQKSADPASRLAK